jgi:mono/diheme cytochrome c family protein
MEVIMSDRPFLVLGLFQDADKLVHGIRALKSTYGDKLEAYTPYPIHGIEKELGIPKSHVGKIVLALGLSGLTLALGFQSWVFTTDYQIQFGGKPYFSWASFVPIVFEVTVLLACIVGAVFGMLVLVNKLPHYSHPILSSRSMPKITRDRFALAVSVDTAEDAARAEAALRQAGAPETEVVHGTDEIGSGPLLPLKPVLATVIICVLAGLGTWHLQRLWNKLPLISIMDEQTKVLPFRANAFYPDGQSMRPLVPGTVSRSAEYAAWTTPEEAGQMLVNPLSVDSLTLAKGRRGYETHCLVCHGQLGDGTKLLSDKYTGAPANLHQARLKEAPDGHLFAVVTAGKNTMAGYGKDIPAADRWAIVHYVRVLQRALDASDADVQAAQAVAAAAPVAQGGSH